jgi:glycerol-3-phosphate dehydrogenase
VSEAEIIEVLKDAPCFDAVKHLTRAGMDCEKCMADIIILMQRRVSRIVKDIEGSDVAWK